MKFSGKTAVIASIMAFSFMISCYDSSDEIGAAGGLLATGKETTAKDGSAVFNVGVARVDITGPFCEISTGYNSPGVVMKGLAMRLYSRAFVVQSPASGKRVVFVSADMLHMYQSIKIGVVKKLAEEGYGDIYTTDNVMISAIHDHSAPSNISWYTLYNLFNGTVGFDRLHYNVVVAGITESIIKAHKSMKPATIKIARGQLKDTAYNRSSAAYNKNYDVNAYESNVDDSMVLLRFQGTDGSDMGMINWFAVHGTSLSINNLFVHGDNKGWAAYQFEKTRPNGFVAAFAQGAMGDVSPNTPNPDDITASFRRPGDLDTSISEIENPIVHGTKQYNKAMELFNAASEPVPAGIDYRHSYVNFNSVSIDPKYVDEFVMPWDTGNTYSTGVACIGAGFLAGDEEGAPVAFAKEGQIKNTFNYVSGKWEKTYYDLTDLDTSSGDALAIVASLLGPIWPLAEEVLGTGKYEDVQKEKFILLPVGQVDDFWFPNPKVPFVPVIVPIQIFTIGDVAIAGTSFEVTTMLGRRIKKALYDILAPRGIKDVIIAGMSNSYGQYITTREEYSAQNFEGSFNLYGPWSGAALEQELCRVAGDLAEGKKTDAGPTPPDLSSQQFIETGVSSSGVVNDDGSFGKVLTDVKSSYSRTKDSVVVVFQGAHPRTVLQLKYDGKLGKYYDPATYTYLEVQKKSGSSWVTVAGDGDPYTRIQWDRTGGSLSPTSKVTIYWDIRNAEAGTYRIKYNGLAKRFYLVTTSYQKFTGCSGEFSVK